MHVQRWCERAGDTCATEPNMWLEIRGMWWRHTTLRRLSSDELMTTESEPRRFAICSFETYDALLLERGRPLVCLPLAKRVSST